MKSNPVEAVWNAFSSNVMVGVDKKSQQYCDMKMAFYSGTFSLFTMLSRLSMTNDKAAEECLHHVEAELETYFTSLEQAHKERN